MVTGPTGGGASAGTPAFTVRVSKRAGQVRLVMTASGELVVVVPRRFDQRAIPAIVEAKRLWIERARARMAARPLPQQADKALPNRVVLSALGEEWHVEYRPARAGRAEPGGAPERRPAVARETPGGRLVVHAPSADEDAYRRALIEWLRRRARSLLVARLEELAVAHGLVFGRVSVRHQHTRWASCSARGAISLNLRLLFLEPALVDHILTHELCHTVELNHSKRFWALMQARDPEWERHRRQAREAWRSLPAWVHAEGAEPRI